MNLTLNDVNDFIKENDIKFIRLAFCDVFGKLKNISIMAEEFEKAMESGIPFDASIIEGFLNEEESDLYLFPDISTLSLLPWRPQQGRVVRMYCNLKRKDGSYFTDGRLLLKKAVDKAKSMGIELDINIDCEFYLFENDENGNPTKKPQDNAGYFDVAPLDKGENVRREICLILEQMGITPISSHHEQGPGQNVVEFKKCNPILCADNLTTLKSVISTTADRNGLFADFSPKPLKDYSGNGMHINMFIYKDGKNILQEENFNKYSQSSQFIAGILNRCKEMTLFLNPEKDSYKRFGNFEAPMYITWSEKNLSQLLRIISYSKEDSKIELRSPDPMCNPYLAFALIINAGLEGIEKKLKLSKSTDFYLFDNKEIEDDLMILPEDLNNAINIAKESTFIKNIIPHKLLNKYIEKKIKEC